MPPDPDDPADHLVPVLRAAGCVFAEDEAAVLREAAGDDVGLLERLTAQRVAGTPLEQVVGWADVAGVRVLLDPGVFVPRQRTALLVRTAVEHLRGHAGGAVVVDLGCGSGALGAAVLAALPGVVVHAADVDPAAVACARRNLPTSAVHEGDLWDALPDGLRGGVAVVLANAPYVPTRQVERMPSEARDHEHRVALDGGPDGLDVVRRVLLGAEHWLADAGLVLVECGERQVQTCLGLAAAGGLRARVVRDDERGALGVAATPDPSVVRPALAG